LIVASEQGEQHAVSYQWIMIIDYKNLIGLSAETKSGLVLGKIKNFEVDSETQTISQYFVKGRGFISKLLSESDQQLIIHRNQVVSISEEKMIVEDNVVKEGEAVKLAQGVGQDAPILSSRLKIRKSDGNL